MGKEKFPRTDEIPWNQIEEIRVSSEDKSFSFEFDLNGKHQKMTISVQPKQTDFTLSKDDGTPIVHATQSKGEVKILDFSSKPSIKGISKSIRFLRPVKKK